MKIGQFSSSARAIKKLSHKNCHKNCSCKLAFILFYFILFYFISLFQDDVKALRWQMAFGLLDGEIK